MKKQNFTLVELSLVMLGLILIAGLSLPYARDFVKKSQLATQAANLKVLDAALQRSFAENGKLPLLEINALPITDETTGKIGPFIAADFSNVMEFYGLTTSKSSLDTILLIDQNKKDVKADRSSAKRANWEAWIQAGKSTPKNNNSLFFLKPILGTDDDTARKYRLEQTFGSSINSVPQGYAQSHLIVMHTAGFPADNNNKLNVNELRTVGVNGMISQIPKFNTDIFYSPYPFVLVKVSSKLNSLTGELDLVHDIVGSFNITRSNRIVSALSNSEEFNQIVKGDQS